METAFPAIQLYAVLALAATLASVVATHLRSSNHMGQHASWLAIVTCGLLVIAWMQLIIVGALAAWREEQVVWSHLTVHLLIIGAMLPIVCMTVCLSWISGAKNSVQQWGTH